MRRLCVPGLTRERDPGLNLPFSTEVSLMLKNHIAPRSLLVLATLAATVGGWIGFVYSRHSRSDRGFILLTAWGLSVALGTFAPLAVQPAVALPTP